MKVPVNDDWTTVHAKPGYPKMHHSITTNCSLNVATAVCI